MSRRILGLAGVLVGSALLTGPGHLQQAPAVSVGEARIPWVGEPPPNAYGGVVAARPGGGLVYAFGHTVMRQIGVRWHQEVFPPTLQFQDVVFSSAGHGLLYAVADSASGALRQLVYTTQNGGATWRPLGSHTVMSEAGLRQHVVWTEQGYAGAASLAWAPEPLTGSIPAVVSTNGIQWHPLQGTPTDLAVTGAAAHAGQWWLAGQVKQGGLLGYLTGTTWHSVLATPAPLSDVAFDGSYGIAVGGNPWMKFLPLGTATQVTYVTHDGGRHWALVNRAVHAPASFSQIFLANQRDAFAAAGQVTMGANGPGYQVLYHTVDGGRHWTRVLTGNFGSVAVTSSQVVSVASARGVLWQSRDGGASWHVITPALVQDTWVGASTTQAKDVFLQVNTGFSSLLLKTTNGGRSWGTIRNLGQDTPVGWFAPSSGVLETGNGKLVAVNGRRTSIVPQPSGVQVLLDAQFSSPQDGWILAGNPNGSSLYKTVDGGRHWQEVSLPLGDAFQVAAAGNRVALVGENSDVAVSRDGGRHWRTQFLHQPAAIFSAAAFAGRGPLWVFGTRGDTNQAMVWQWNGAQLVAHTAGQSAQSAAFGVGGVGWAVAEGQALYRSTTGGRSWQYFPVRFSHPIAWAISP